MKQTILCFATTALWVTFAQAPKPTAAAAPTDPGMYVPRANGLAKILGQSVTFNRSGSLALSGLTLPLSSVLIGGNDHENSLAADLYDVGMATYGLGTGHLRGKKKYV